MSAIELQAIRKHYPGGITALDLNSVEIRRGERLVVLGPSGSGKTTLLRIIAGLESPDTGSVRIGGMDMGGVPPHRRDVSMVFQTPALYPYLNVRDNLAFGLHARGASRLERSRSVEEIAEVLGLSQLLTRRPSQLSGGERQRVALGRAFVRKPAILLLDEPFVALDIPLRDALRGELVALHERFGCTLIHVTHDQQEALSIGQEIAVMESGRIIQLGTPRDIYDQPSNLFVASFLGSPPMNLLPCRLARLESHHRIDLGSSGTFYPFDLSGPSFLPECGPEANPRELRLGIRPEHVALDDRQGEARGEIRNGILMLPVVIRGLEFRGESSVVRLDAWGIPIASRIPAESPIREGQTVMASLDLSKVHWFDPSTRARILS